MKRYSTLLLALLISFAALHAQQWCGGDNLLKTQMLSDPETQRSREAVAQQLEAFREKHGGQADFGIPVTIPVIVHIIWNTAEQNLSDQQAQSQIDVLNEDFRALNAGVANIPVAFAGLVADCQINFCLAKRDPQGFPTSGIERRQTNVADFSDLTSMKYAATGGMDAWDRNSYLNIWVCNIQSTGFGGFATYPGSQAQEDGVVCDYRYFGTINSQFPFNHGRTTTHETGHWLNCKHIFGDSDTETCVDSDDVDDTPNQLGLNSGCPSFPSISCGNGPNGDMFMNYMDYTDDLCKDMFTLGQKMRMQALFEEGGFRRPLLQSRGCEDACSGPLATAHVYKDKEVLTDISLPGDLIVHSGAELRVSGKIAMRKDARIIVERNARLKLTGGTLTRACGDHDWQGVVVLGNSAKEQPGQDAPLTDPEQAGIFVSSGGTVEWARCGVSAGGGYGPEYWGGLLWTEFGAVFQSNRKDAEFLSYMFKVNKSRFYDTKFDAKINSFENTEGVSIWETNGIEFHTCGFYNKAVHAIRTFDAGVKVLDGCRFEMNKTGISTYATHDFSSTTEIGAASGPENNFYGNKYDINASLSSGFWGGYSNGYFSLEIINNNFEGADYGVSIDGRSNFRVGGNWFTDVATAISCANSGYNSIFNQNLLACNRFSNHMNLGIVAIGDNKQMQFLGNEFELAFPASSRDFVLSNSTFPGLNGAIRELQGDIGTPASNCFSNPALQVDISTQALWGGATDFFTYYYKPAEACDSEPLSPGNYDKQGISPETQTINCSQFGGLPSDFSHPVPADLVALRLQLQTLFPGIATDAGVKLQYYKLLQDKEFVLKNLLGQALDTQNHELAENLLLGEQNASAQWAVLGLRLKRRDYTAAGQWLDQIVVQNTAEQQLRDIERINLQRLQAPATFLLSEAQEAFLSSVAESDSPVRGYARGILALLTGREFYPDNYEFGEEREPMQAQVESHPMLQVYPVPASDAIQVSWPLWSLKGNSKLQVFDMYGTIQIEEVLSNAEQNRVLNLSQVPEGVYLLLLSDASGQTHHAKFIVQH